MSYQITYTNTKNQASDPSFPEWVSSLDDNYLTELYPELNGATPAEVLDSVVISSQDPAAGFISAVNTVSDDGSITTLVELWENQAAWQAAQTTVNPEADPDCNVGTISCSTTSTTVTGTGTNFNHLLYNDRLVTSTGTIIGNVDSITSNTSLTLQSNAGIDLTDATLWLVGHKPLAIDYLYDQYPYTVTTEVTTANV